jgi:HPt (histidine-containing phosphotransfer) domain-containing protein
MMKIDESALDRLRALNKPNEKDFALEMLETFLAKSAENQEWIDALTYNKRFHEEQNKIHSLKSVAAALGLTTLSQSAAKLEKLVNNGQYDECIVELEAFKQTYAEAIKAVSQYIAS